MTTQARPNRPEMQRLTLVPLAVAADEFGVSVKTLRRRISDGTIRGYRLGRFIRVDLQELQQRLIVEIPTTK